MSDFSEPSEKSAATPPRLLDQVRDRLRVKHYRLRTEQAYVGWIKRYIIFHQKRHPAEMGKQELAINGVTIDFWLNNATRGWAGFMSTPDRVH